MSGNLHVKDYRTLREYQIKVENNVVKASDLANIKGPMDVGDQQALPEQRLLVFDPGYENTAVMASSVTFA